MQSNQETTKIQYFSPNPVLGTNYHLNIQKVTRVLIENFGSQYTFTCMYETIYIENKKTKAKNCTITYKDQINYATAPWTLAKEFCFKEFYSCGNSEQSIYNPSESDIIEFFERNCKQ